MHIAVDDPCSNDPGPATGYLIGAHVKALTTGAEVPFKVVEESHRWIPLVNDRGGILQVEVAAGRVDKERIHRKAVGPGRGAAAVGVRRRVGVVIVRRVRYRTVNSVACGGRVVGKDVVHQSRIGVRGVKAAAVGSRVGVDGIVSHSQGNSVVVDSTAVGGRVIADDVVLQQRSAAGMVESAAVGGLVIAQVIGVEGDLAAGVVHCSTVGSGAAVDQGLRHGQTAISHKDSASVDGVALTQVQATDGNHRRVGDIDHPPPGHSIQDGWVGHRVWVCPVISGIAAPDGEGLGQKNRLADRLAAISKGVHPSANTGHLEQIIILALSHRHLDAAVDDAQTLVAHVTAAHFIGPNVKTLVGGAWVSVNVVGDGAVGVARIFGRRTAGNAQEAAAGRIGGDKVGVGGDVAGAVA